MTDDTPNDDTTDAQTGGPDAAEETATGATVGDGGTAAEPPATDAATEAGTGASETPPTDDGDGGEASAESRSTGERLAWLVQVAGLVVLSLLALVATFRVYIAASNAISVWISRDFVSLFQVAFNLLVLIVAVYGISVLVRRLS